MAIVPVIAAVSYLNTIPFVYGIRHEGNLRADLRLSPPSTCAKLFQEGEADIALLPAAAVPQLRLAEIVTDYCIGAVQVVRTVVVVSNTPIERARRIFLDTDSLTSVQLTGFLAQNVWHIKPEYYTLSDYSQLAHAEQGDAFLLIGDKVFAHEGEFRYCYDLAEEWQRAQGLPFVFAVWVARKGLSFSVTDALQTALTYGVEHTYEAIVEGGFDHADYNAYEYLTRNIDFLFDAQKRRALQKFWDAGIKIVPKVNPG